MTDQQAIVVPLDIYIVPSEAARILGVSSAGLRRMVREGQLTHIRFTPGQHRRYNLKEVLQLAQTRRTQAER